MLKVNGTGLIEQARTGGHEIAWQRAAVIALLLVGFALWLHDLDALTLWNDETWTLDATAPDGSVVRLIDKVREDVHPPLFFVELYGWRQIVGETVFELRYLSVLLMLIGGAVTYRAGRDLFSPLAGWIAALILALHDLTRVLTQEVRHYPQHMLAGALIIWLYWRFWRRPSRGRGIAFVLAGAALLWTHYWGGFVLLALAIHAVLTKRQISSSLFPSPHVERVSGGGARPFVLAFAGIGMLFAPWLPGLAHQMTVERPDGLPHALENSWVVYKSLAFHLLGVPELFWLVLMIAGMAGGLALARWRPTPASLLLALVLMLPVTLTIVLNAVYPALSPRSLAVVVPAAALLVGHALAQFGRSERALMVAFVALHGLATTSSIPNDRAPWPDVADYLARHSAAGDVVLLEIKNNEWNNMEEYTLDYYLDHSRAAIRSIWTEDRRLSDPDGFTGDLRDQLREIDSLWIVGWGWMHYDLRADLRRWGFVETAPALDFEPFNAMPVQVWRFDRAPSGDPQVTFDGVLRLAQAEVVRRDDGITVNLLWSAARTPDRDYTVSAFVLDENGALVAQHDSYPLENRAPTSGWQADWLYFDSHPIPVGKLPPGIYRVAIKVYSFADARFEAVEIALASDCGADPACEFVIIEEITIR